MTTNHRPTLESKRGKVQAISDTISHSRALPQQTQLKYRSDLRTKIDPNKISIAVEELKQELLKNEGKINNEESGYDRHLSYNDEKEDVQKNSIQPEKSIENVSSLSEENNRDAYNEDNKEEVFDNESNSDEESDSDDETAQLMIELAKIKQEKEEERKKIELEEKTKLAAISNPLVKVENSDKDNEQNKVKKNWRKNTAFRLKNKINESKSTDYTNDTLNSEYHQNFLSKYIR